MNQSLTKLQDNIEYHFKDPNLLATALTHRSCLNEPDVKESNERLEFLGDAVLELVITNFLYHQRPTDPEGILTAARSAIVKTQSLSTIAKTINLGEYLRMSRGEAASGGRENLSLLEDAFESLVGAIYEDGGLDSASDFLYKHVIPFAKEVLSANQLKDAKSLLQEKVQSMGYISPTYKVISEKGPDHHKTFEVEVVINGQSKGVGTGKSKQEAEQQAAQITLQLL